MINSSVTSRRHLQRVISSFLVVSLTLLLTAVSGCAKQQVFPGESWERIESTEAVGYDSEKMAAAGEFAKTLDTTGFMVIVGGRVLYEYGNIDTLTYMASVRKSILAML